MLQERRNKIMEILREDGIVKVSELMKLFDVSIETIRRDLEYLEEHGMLGLFSRGLRSHLIKPGKSSIIKRRRLSGKGLWSWLRMRM